MAGLGLLLDFEGWGDVFLVFFFFMDEGLLWRVCVYSYVATFSCTCKMFLYVQTQLRFILLPLRNNSSLPQSSLLLLATSILYIYPLSAAMQDART
jgi:hypothetical protein